MFLKHWEDLPEIMKTEEVRPYYDVLRKRKGSLALKRIFDFLVSLPLHTLLTDEDIDTVCDALRNVMAELTA